MDEVNTTNGGGDSFAQPRTTACRAMPWKVIAETYKASTQPLVPSHEEGWS